MARGDAYIVEQVVNRPRQAAYGSPHDKYRMSGCVGARVKEDLVTVVSRDERCGGVAAASTQTRGFRPSTALEQSQSSSTSENGGRNVSR